MSADLLSCVTVIGSLGQSAVPKASLLQATHLSLIGTRQHLCPLTTVHLSIYCILLGQFKALSIFQRSTSNTLPSVMGLSFEAPISLLHTSYDKATRRDSPHPSTFSPFHPFKSRRTRRNLLRSQSTSVVAGEVVMPENSSPVSKGVPTKESALFTLPLHLRQHIYSLIIDPAQTRTLHLLLKHDHRHDQLTLRHRACRATRIFDQSCVSARCKTGHDQPTCSYRGSFDSFGSLLLLSSVIHLEVTEFLYAHFNFDFDHPLAVQTLCSTRSPATLQKVKSMTFVPQLSLFSGRSFQFGADLDTEMWLNTWRSLNDCCRLEGLQVTFKGPNSKLAGNLEVLDPRPHITCRDSLEINFQAPWIQL